MLPQSSDLSPRQVLVIPDLLRLSLGVLVGDGVCLFIIQHFIWDLEGGGHQPADVVCENKQTLKLDC